jgi:hypothetical protein
LVHLEQELLVGWPLIIKKRCNMKRLILILIALAAISLSLSSCVTQKKCESKFPPKEIIKDSINTKESVIYRDTTIRDTIPGDTVEVPVIIEVSNGKLVNKKRKQVFENTFIKVDLAITAGKPIVWVIRLEQFRDYYFQKIYAQKLTEHYKNSTKVVIVTETKTPFWNWILIGFLIAIILYLIIRH